MKSKIRVFTLFIFFMFMLFAQSLRAEMNMNETREIDQDSLEQVIETAEGKAKLTPILMYCQKFMSRSPRKCLSYAKSALDDADFLGDSRPRFYLLNGLL